MFDSSRTWDFRGRTTGSSEPHFQGRTTGFPGRAPNGPHRPQSFCSSCVTFVFFSPARNEFVLLPQYNIYFLSPVFNPFVYFFRKYHSGVPGCLRESGNPGILMRKATENQFCEVPPGKDQVPGRTKKPAAAAGLSPIPIADFICSRESIEQAAFLIRRRSSHFPGAKRTVRGRRDHGREKTIEREKGCARG